MLWDILVSIFWFMLLFTWMWLLFMIFGDLFRDHELSGWAKAAWVFFLLVMPWLGALIYLGVRGRSMNERAREQAARNEEELRGYVQRAAAGPPSTADDLAKLADLRDRRVISSDEFAQAKARLLGAQAPDTATPRVDRSSPVG